MAELKLGNIKPVGEDNVVVEGKYVKGGYVVVADIAERNALKGNNGENIIEGSLCYCQADKKFYQYDSTNGWVDARLDGLAARIDNLDYTYSGEGEQVNKTYFVKSVSQEDGKITITREALPDIQISSEKGSGTLGNGQTFTAIVDIEEVADTESEDNGHKIKKTVKDITIPEIAIEENDNLTIDTAVPGKIKLGHGAAEEGNDSVANEVLEEPAQDSKQLKDTDSIKLSTTTYDANGHKNGTTSAEYKMPKLSEWTWENGTEEGPTAKLTGEGVTTLNIPDIPSASSANSGIVTTKEQSFSGDKTFTDNVSISGDLTVSGTTTSVDFETAVAKENIIITNSENTSLAGKASGIAIMTGKTDPSDDSIIAYGIMYDPTDDLIKIGEGSVTDTDNNYEFSFKEGEKEVIATREYVDAADQALQDNLNAFENSIGFTKTDDETFAERIDRIFATKDSLEKEKESRTEAENALDKKIDDLTVANIANTNITVPGRENSDVSTLDKVLQQEVSVRNDQVVGLNMELKKEIQRASQAETNLNDTLNKEEKRATDAEEALSNKIESLNLDDIANTNLTVPGMEGAEANSLKDVLTQEFQVRNAQTVGLNQALKEEINRATKAEETLNDNLGKETKRAEDAEDELKKYIDDLFAAEWTINSNYEED